MILLGAHRTISASAHGEDAVAAFYVELIPRLEARLQGRLEAAQPPAPSRLVGYRAELDTQTFWQFLGIELPAVESIPQGLAAMRLGEDSGELVDDGHVTQFDLAWAWHDASRQFAVGEFDGSLWPAAVTMTANASLPPAEDAIELAEYDPAWPGQFDEMARRLRELAPDVAHRVVHYGSTAIPGMPAKPIIDILVEAPSFDDARRSLIPAFNDPCWEYWWYADHMIFIKRDRPRGVRTHHVHIAPPGHQLWDGVLFRDYLIGNPEAAREYADLKFELADRFRTEREKYTDAKTAFVSGILQKAGKKELY